ncbi:YdiU family protein [Photobacterium sp. GB-56]|uniref:protein adenylyltransferase SelO n=1 Tax=Photobacterium sp. GB-56 TaxID=2022106 RepID=UPI000D182273|nr:YdiU family protein [Photobacterium sp. GB-56]PSV27379.1 YdiU family protein [Photobacterium sp. GB-56]
MKSLQQLVFNNTYSQLPSLFGTFVSPQPLSNPYLISVNPHIAKLLELDINAIQSDDFINIFSGNDTLAGFDPIAMKYTGHQFGQYNPDLGDGRGLLLGEVQTSHGKKWDIHLKGSGLTPYSRMGDGRAVIRSSIREYLASAAMAGLGIPTSHALAVIGSDTHVYREKQEFGATLLRISESHIRFGHFEYLFYTQQHDQLRLLADYVIQHHFPECQQVEKPYAALFEQVCENTAKMIAHWQAVGFAHGVMNTDNMSILGLTFDYGPYGFLDDYNPGYICNHSDYSGRYAFNQQPSIGLWNLSALGYALAPIIDKSDIEHALEIYQHQLQVHYSKLMRQKLGLFDNQEQDTELFQQLFNLLKQQSIDYTQFFRTLSTLSQDELDNTSSHFSSLTENTTAIDEWLADYKKRISNIDDQQRLALMLNSNPKYILRNYLAQLAIDAAEQGNFTFIENLLTVLHDPFDEHPNFEDLADLPPKWGKELEISCSS